MKDYIFLRWSQFNHYRYINDYAPFSNLKFLIDFFSSDYKDYDINLFQRIITCYNEHFIYNDIKNNIFYIGWSEWEYSDGEMHCPEEEEFPTYLTQTNNCKIKHDNFIELTKKLMLMKKNPIPFAIIYRDDDNWVDCKAFNTQEEMEFFVQHHQSDYTH